MGLIARALAIPAPQRRSLSFQSVWGAGDDWPGSRNESGVNVTQTTALGLTTTYACVSLLADTVSTLPARVIKHPTPDTTIVLPRPSWVIEPEADNPSMTWEAHLSEVMVSLLLDGNAFIYTAREPGGEVLEVRALDPSKVTPKRRGGKLVYEVPSLGKEYTADEVRHVWHIRRPGDLRGLSPIEAARQSIGKYMAADTYGARFFGSGANLSGVLQTKSNMAQQEADDLKAKFVAKYGGVGRSFGVAVLDNGAEWKPLSVTPDQAQFISTLVHGVEDVARLFRVPPYMVGSTQPGAMANASVEGQGIYFEGHTVRPWVELLEAAYSSFLPPGQTMQLNTNGLLRTDFKTRMEGLAVGVQNGIVLRSEARRIEDLSPLDGADRPMVQLNMADPANADMTQRVAALASLVRSGFDPAAAATAVGLTPIAHTGAVPVTVYPEVPA